MGNSTKKLGWTANNTLNFLKKIYVFGGYRMAILTHYLQINIDPTLHGRFSVHFFSGLYSALFIPSHDTVDGRNPAPVDRWFIPLFIGFQHVSTILLVVQDFATIHSSYIPTWDGKTPKPHRNAAPRFLDRSFGFHSAAPAAANVAHPFGHQQVQGPRRKTGRRAPENWGFWGFVHPCAGCIPTSLVINIAI